MTSRKSKLYDKVKMREISDDFNWHINRVLKHYLKEHDVSDVDITKGKASPAIAAVRHLSEQVFSKLNDPSVGVPSKERRQAAIVKWLGVERRNQGTNKRIPTTNPSFLLGKKSGCKSDAKPQRVAAWDMIYSVRTIIRGILGDCPDGNDLVDFLLEKGDFTSGASTSKKRSLDTLARKYTERLDATPSLLRLLHNSDFRAAFEGWSEITAASFEDPRLVKGNILFTVPKNAEIDRVACKEPDLNLYCQKALGGHIRTRLRKAGINLNDQTRNQTLASQAFKRGYATIDLSSASDSLTVELVKQLVSPDWFNLFMALRSPKTFIDGCSHENAMISSMGNGYTFELESLIFYSIANAMSKTVAYKVGSGHLADAVVGIYGDDIIVHRRVARPLIAFLGWCGFKTNVKKSFVSGSFFESCGKHYYCGYDVSPFYIREPFSDISDLVLSLNQLRSWMIRTGVDLYETIEPTVVHSFFEVWSKFTLLVPRSLWGGWDCEIRTQLVTPGQSRCRLVPVLKPERRVTKDYQMGMYLARLSGKIDNDKAAFDPLLNPMGETRLSDELPSRWTGEWIIRRHYDRARFFGIATEPLNQEVKISSYCSPRT